MSRVRKGLVMMRGGFAMGTGWRTVCALTAGALFIAVPAAAQDAPDAGPDSSAYKGDYLIVGVGLGSVPSYEGSDDETVIPAAAVTGRIKGVNIGARSAGLSLDFVPDKEGGRIGFALGPVIRYRGNRTSHIKDPVVAKLGKLNGTIETGIAAGVAFRKVLTPADSLSVGADMRWDISGNGGGRVVTAGISYFTPINHAVVVGASVAADFIDDQYARYNFSVSQAGSAASGLPAYTAHGGMKNWAVRMFAAYDLDRNIENGGFAIGGGVSYSRLTGSAAETPITSERGSRDQVIFGGGIAYTF